MHGDKTIENALMLPYNYSMGLLALFVTATKENPKRSTTEREKKESSVSRLQGVGEEVHRKDIPSTDWDWPIYPKGMFDQLIRIKNLYKRDKEVYITENGMGCKDKFLEEKQTVEDDERIDYLKRHMDEVSKAIESGVNVRGYFVWSLQDMFSWTNGYSKRYGLFYVDFESQRRYPKKSAYWYKEVSETKKV